MEDSMRDKLLMAETENASMKAKIEGLLREIENKQIIIQQNKDAKTLNTDQVEFIQASLREEKKKNEKAEEKIENL